jgi:3-hydroxy-9,10-secoandrosta-1,3,5(10)-triene-9,17-dione monooxygenase
MFGDDPSAGELATDFIGVVDYADCEIIDNWDVLGLRGTGSKRVVVEDVFVPERRTIDSIFRLDAPPAPGRTVHDAAIYREGTIGGLIFSETASVAIGTAWGVLDLYEESMRKRKTTVLPLIPMTEHAQYPRFFGEAFQLIDVAECALLQSDYDYMEWSRRAAEEDFEFGMDLDRRLQLRKQYCAKLAYDAVNLMMRTNGSAGMRGGAMWQRYQRDLTVLMTHNTVQPELAADSFGRLHFGLLPHGVDPQDGPAPPPVR